MRMVSESYCTTRVRDLNLSRRACPACCLQAAPSASSSFWHSYAAALHSYTHQGAGRSAVCLGMTCVYFSSVTSPWECMVVVAW